MKVRIANSCRGDPRCYPVLTERGEHGLDRLDHSHVALNVGSCASRRGSKVCKDTVACSAHTSREWDGRPRGRSMRFTDLEY